MSGESGEHLIALRYTLSLAVFQRDERVSCYLPMPSKLDSYCWDHMPRGWRSAKVTVGLPTPFPLLERSSAGLCTLTVQLTAAVVMAAADALQS